MSRYVEASKVYHMDATLRLAPEGQCQWCGKSLPKRCKVFCPSVIEEWYQGHFHRVQRCANAFFAYWQRVPRFKRVIFVRDKFTCQACGLRPTKVNKHGLIIPAIGLLAIDHIYPHSRGGSAKPENLQVLCRKCNARKRDKLEYVVQGELTL